MINSERPVITGIIERYVEDAMFLWLRRNRAIRAADCSLADIARTDDRLDAVIEGLKLAGDSGWNLCRDAFSYGGPGALFAPAVLAFTSARQEWIEELLGLGEKSLDHSRPIISALGWIGSETALPHIQSLLSSPNEMHKRIGIGACAVLRIDAGNIMTNAFSSTEPLVRSRSLRMAGELGNKKYGPLCEVGLNDADESCRFWAAWSLAVLGERKGLDLLQQTVEKTGPFSEIAADIISRCIDPGKALAWQKDLAKSKKNARIAVRVAGILGIAALLPWLIEQMHRPELARAAGSAFRQITGVVIDGTDLQGQKPPGFQSGPAGDLENSNFEMDPDEKLPWPSPSLVLEWWKINGAYFKEGIRYIGGLPVNPANLQQVLVIGSQDIRAACALELAIRQPGRPLFEVRSPAWEQRRALRNITIS